MSAPDPPERLQARGRRLWAALHVQYPTMSPAEGVIAELACSAADHLAPSLLPGRGEQRIDGVLDREPLMFLVDGQVRPHPLLREQRQWCLHFSRLVASLRLPDRHGRRPQRRGPRGVYRPRGAS